MGSGSIPDTRREMLEPIFHVEMPFPALMQEKGHIPALTYMPWFVDSHGWHTLF